MGQTDSKRVHHEITDQPNAFRDFTLEQIVNDLGEEDTGLGFTELIEDVLPNPPFTKQIIVWTDGTKTNKRSHTTINRTGAFVTSIVKEIYESGVKKATISMTVTRSGSNKVLDGTVTVTRP